MTNDRRLELEMSIIRRLVKDALAKDYTVSVNDGEEWTVVRSSKPGEILAAVRTTDEDVLQFRARADGAAVGKVWLVYGNMPYEVISDHSDNAAMDELLKGANALADRVEERC